jgi:hypothetical protein
MRVALAGIGIAIAAWLLWMASAVHLERACVLMDTPYLPLCKDPASERLADRIATLRLRLAANPGDAQSWIQLTSLERGPLEKPLLLAAATLAPNDPNVLMWRAGDLLSRQKLPEAVDLLIQLVVYRNRSEAAQALARILASGEGVPLLRPHLGTANRWLPQVLASLAALKLPLPSALPLLAEASSKGMVGRQTTLSYIGALKAAGAWGDAYSLWLSQQKGPTPLLHNGRFDQAFEAGGFDWEVTPALPSRAGAVVAQRGSGNRGQVLDIQFTGRPLATPIIRQYVFAPPGKYILRGQYMASRLRLDEGLAWAARCDGGTAILAGRSPALQDTAGAWQPFQFEISVPNNCGVVFSLQLETTVPSAASAGGKGHASFDAMELVAQRL